MEVCFFRETGMANKFLYDISLLNNIKDTDKKVIFRRTAKNTSVITLKILILYYQQTVISRK
jgi:hypothetical protein